MIVFLASWPKTQGGKPSFVQNFFPWPNKLRRKTRKKESSAEKHRNFAVSKEQKQVLPTQNINNVSFVH
jgi:hypothetical protein